MASSSKISMLRKTYFKQNWLNDTNHPWLREYPKDNTRFYCVICKKDFDLSNMGKGAVNSHGKKKDHSPEKQTSTSKSSQQSLKMFLTPEATPKVEDNKGNGVFELNFEEGASTSSTSKLKDQNNNEGQQLCIPDPPEMARPAGFDFPKNRDCRCLSDKEAKQKATESEISWALKCVLDHTPLTKTNDINQQFQFMFSDSKIAENFSMGEKKAAYLITFGIAPYFKDQLLRSVQEAECYVISFDESFNHTLGLEQMDFIVRFLNGRRIVSRYLKSRFLGHTTSADILENFTKGIEEFDTRKILQISMDGPKTNHKFLREFKEEREDLPKLMDLGVCSLHVIHGALTYGMQKTEWKLDSILRALHYLFDHSPARCEDYQTITKSSTFPLPFCVTRWVEDVPVAKQAIQIWSHITKYVKETEKKPKKDIPKISSYEKVRDAV